MLIKQQLHTGNQAKPKYCSLISSTHVFQIPLLLHCVWVFCSGWISFSWSYYTEGCVCMHLDMVLLQSEALKMMCSGWVMAARKSFFFFHIIQKTFPPTLTRSLWQANNTCYIFFKKQVMCFKAVKNCCLYHTSCLSPG